MAIYNFIRVDESANIMSRESHDCSDEAEALELACRIADGCIVEVWCGTAFITTIKPEDKTG